MAPRLTVDEASTAYERSMRNVLSGQTPGICGQCKTFVDAQYSECLSCRRQPNPAQTVVPITYSLHGGQMHHALRSYKDDLTTSARRYASVRLAGILWRFLDLHEQCVARDAGVSQFDLVTTVPSSTPGRDEERDLLRTIVGWSEPVSGRYERVLMATGKVPTGRGYDEDRYECQRKLDGENVLLIDDTWTGGGHAQSAARMLVCAGAGTVAMVVIGRHLRSEWSLLPGGEETSGDRFKALPRQFDWSACCVH